jgi:heme/copper-type cytochrome/quinol oxidase subunit 2
VLRRLFTFAIILICILWLVVSYLPGIRAMLPTFSLVGSNSQLAWLGVAALIVFVAIQLWLVYTTVVNVRAYQAKNNGSAFRLRLSAEFFWTALPIMMTIALACASYGLWVNLAKP